MKKEFLKKISYVTIVMLVVLVVFSITKITDVAEAQSANYNMAGTWQNITTSQTSNTFSISGSVYGSAIFEGFTCPAPTNPNMGGNSAGTFSSMTYTIYNSSGQAVSNGPVYYGVSQNGNTCVSQDYFSAYIHDFTLDADISALSSGDYSILLVTSVQYSDNFTQGTTLSYTAYFTKSASATCTISSFTCNSSATLSWVTANCSNRSITPNIGSVSASGSTNGSAGTTYTLTADTLQSVASCAPANPSLVSSWVYRDPNLTTTELNQGYADVILNYNNTGDTGSCVNNIECIPSPTQAATNAQPYCEVKTICK